LLLVAAGGYFAWSYFRSRSYRYQDQPIEALNYWIGYYADTTCNKGADLGTIPLTNGQFRLDYYIPHNTTASVSISAIDRIQLNFAFRHHAPNAQSASNPWRVANQHGKLLGTDVPIDIRNKASREVLGTLTARSHSPHYFEFALKLGKALASLPAGEYQLVIRLDQTRLAQKKQKAELFAPKYYPTYVLECVIPDS